MKAKVCLDFSPKGISDGGCDYGACGWLLEDLIHVVKAARANDLGGLRRQKAQDRVRWVPAETR